METQTVKHTKGPWRYDAGDVLNPDRAFGIIAHDDAEGPDGDATQCVAEVCDGLTAEADARLIAAAPALLEACKLGLHWMDMWDMRTADEHLREDIATVRAAIALAEGRTP